MFCFVFKFTALSRTFCADSYFGVRRSHAGVTCRSTQNIPVILPYPAISVLLVRYPPPAPHPTPPRVTAVASKGSRSFCLPALSVLTQTPSTGLRHPSFKEGAVKRCSECACADSVLVQYPFHTRVYCSTAVACEKYPVILPPRLPLLCCHFGRIRSILRVTAAACKISWSFIQQCRWQARY